MNRVMKPMTVGGSILPGTALIGTIYGMNIGIPNTHWASSYLLALLTMLALTVGLTVCFKRKGYL